MCRTARAGGVDCDRLSFTDTLRAVRRSVTSAPGVFSPGAADHRAHLAAG
jgi:hypothetical protein